MFMGKLGQRRTRGVPSHQHERGAALVEFALIASLLVLLVLGIVEFGWKFGQFNDVRHGAREGARFAAVNAGDEDAIRDHICNSMDALSAGMTSIDIDLVDGATGTIGETARVSVTATVNSLTGAPLITTFLPNTLESDIQFRLEQNSGSWDDATRTCP